MSGIGISAFLGPKDIVRGKREALEKRLDVRMFSVGKEAVRILEDWKGEPSMEKLTRQVGKEK